MNAPLFFLSAFAFPSPQYSPSTARAEPARGAWPKRGWESVRYDRCFAEPTAFGLLKRFNPLENPKTAFCSHLEVTRKARDVWRNYVSATLRFPYITRVSVILKFAEFSSRTAL
ncbi:hypothetical protein DM860_010174 [Cuscuta australis]|uniref:Uncharacterized protein n=1 Tax=Cuscuta australis TaxID=267555 RepID=A0A328D884_9ASTE|nr:hypothetical protein DM860_010174 [Cuscuta australis]